MIFIPVKYIRPGKNVQEAEQGQGFAWVHAGLFLLLIVIQWIGDRNRTLIYQAVSQYTPSRYVPIELLLLFPQIISLDISQRSVSLIPFP